MGNRCFSILAEREVGRGKERARFGPKNELAENEILLAEREEGPILAEKGLALYFRAIN